MFSTLGSYAGILSVDFTLNFQLQVPQLSITYDHTSGHYRSVIEFYCLSFNLSGRLNMIPAKSSIIVKMAKKKPIKKDTPKQTPKPQMSDDSNDRKFKEPPDQSG